MHWLFNSTPLKFFVQSFWRDEAFSYLLAKHSIFEIIGLTVKDFNPPFYYIVLHLWMTIFGNSEIALRSLSLIFYWATLYVMFDFMHDFLKISYKRAVFYLLFFIINPILGYYAFEARMYTMLAFFAVASWYCLLRPFKRLYIVSLVLGLYTHYFMIFVVLTQILWMSLIGRHDPHVHYPDVTSHSKNMSKLVSWLKIMGIALVWFLPWILYFMISHRPTSDNFWIDSVKPRDFLLLPATMYTGLEHFFDYLYKTRPGLFFTMASISLTIITLLVAGYKKVLNKKIYTALLLWAGVPVIFTFIISFYKTYFLPRYLIFSAVGMLLAIAYALNSLGLRARAGCLALLVILTLWHTHYQLDYREKDPMDRIIGQVKNSAKPGDLLYVTDVLDFHTAQYYFGTENVYLYTVTYDEVPSFVGQILIPKEKLRFSLPAYPKKAFILQKDGRVEIQSSL